MLQKCILPLALLLLLSSCAGRFGLVKRRYGKGYYVSHTKAPESGKQLAHAKTSPAPPQQRTQNQSPAEVPALAAQQPVEPAAAFANKPQTAAATAVKGTRHPKPLVASAAKQKPAAAKSKTAFKPLLLQKSALAAAAKDESGAKLVVLVILCFLWWLNLIAVYVHDDAITLNFWITLLLDFTVIGGIIFSLLVVLDVVDIRNTK